MFRGFPFPFLSFFLPRPPAPFFSFLFSFFLFPPLEKKQNLFDTHEYWHRIADVSVAFLPDRLGLICPRSVYIIVCVYTESAYSPASAGGWLVCVALRPQRRDGLLGTGRQVAARERVYDLCGSVCVIPSLREDWRVGRRIVGRVGDRHLFNPSKTSS